MNAVFTYGGTFADGGARPLDVTFNQSGTLAAITLGGASGSWTGNFTNNGGTINISASDTRLGASDAAQAGRLLVFNNTAMNWTVNNIMSGANATTMILNNCTFNSTRYNVFGPLVLNGSTLDRSEQW